MFSTPTLDASVHRNSVKRASFAGQIAGNLQGLKDFYDEQQDEKKVIEPSTKMMKNDSLGEEKKEESVIVLHKAKDDGKGAFEEERKAEKMQVSRPTLQKKLSQEGPNAIAPSRTSFAEQMRQASLRNLILDDLGEESDDDDEGVLFDDVMGLSTTKNEATEKSDKEKKDILPPAKQMPRQQRRLSTIDVRLLGIDVSDKEFENDMGISVNATGKCGEKKRHQKNEDDLDGSIRLYDDTEDNLFNSVMGISSADKEDLTTSRRTSMDLAMDSDEEDSATAAQETDVYNLPFKSVFKPNEMRCLALVAHNHMKPAMKDFVLSHKEVLKKFRLTGTNTTMTMLRNVFGDDPNVMYGPTCQSGPLGGDAELCALMCLQDLGGIIFFVDPLSAHPHQADIDSLLRLANVHNIMTAPNPASAHSLCFVMKSAMELGRKDMFPSFFYNLQSPGVEVYKAEQRGHLAKNM